MNLQIVISFGTAHANRVGQSDKTFKVMKTQFISTATLFQDRPLPDTMPRHAWQRLTAGDEQAERFEGFMRGALVVGLFCTVFICGLRFRPAADAADHSKLASPTVQVPQAIVQTPAALPQTVALN